MEPSEIQPWVSEVLSYLVDPQMEVPDEIPVELFQAALGVIEGLLNLIVDDENKPKFLAALGMRYAAAGAGLEGN